MRGAPCMGMMVHSLTDVLISGLPLGTGPANVRDWGWGSLTHPGSPLVHPSSAVQERPGGTHRLLRRGHNELQTQGSVSVMSAWLYRWNT